MSKSSHYSYGCLFLPWKPTPDCRGKWCLSYQGAALLSPQRRRDPCCVASPQYSDSIHILEISIFDPFILLRLFKMYFQNIAKDSNLQGVMFCTLLRIQFNYLFLLFGRENGRKERYLSIFDHDEWMCTEENVNVNKWCCVTETWDIINYFL